MKKTVKIIVAAAMLACVTAAFFGYGTDLACRIQPAATVWFLAVLLLTPLGPHAPWTMMLWHLAGTAVLTALLTGVLCFIRPLDLLREKEHE